MSSALIRQALEFVDPEESGGKRNKRRSGSRQQSGSAGQDHINPYARNKKVEKKEVKTSVDIAEQNIKKLLALSTPSVDKTTAEKIIERAIKGKPLAEKIEVVKEEQKSILFPEESFEDFENELFCS